MALEINKTSSKEMFSRNCC